MTEPATTPATPAPALPEPGTPEHASLLAHVEEWLTEHVPGALRSEVATGEKALEAAGRVAALLPRILAVLAETAPAAAEKITPLVTEAEKIAADLGL